MSSAEQAAHSLRVMRVLVERLSVKRMIRNAAKESAMKNHLRKEIKDLSSTYAKQYKLLESACALAKLPIPAHLKTPEELTIWLQE